jgi:hypothetical protein
MGRRRKDGLAGFAQEIEGLALDDLNDLRVALGREHHEHIEAAKLSRKKLDTIKNVMFVRKNGGQIGITDHAVLRYMERYKGVDVRAVREEINAIAQHRKLIEGTDGHYEANGVTIILPQGAVIATILPRAQSPAQPDPTKEE